MPPRQSGRPEDRSGRASESFRDAVLSREEDALSNSTNQGSSSSGKQPIPPNQESGSRSSKRKSGSSKSTRTSQHQHSYPADADAIQSPYFADAEDSPSFSEAHPTQGRRTMYKPSSTNKSSSATYRDAAPAPSTRDSTPRTAQSSSSRHAGHTTTAAAEYDDDGDEGGQSEATAHTPVRLARPRTGSNLIDDASSSSPGRVFPSAYPHTSSSDDPPIVKSRRKMRGLK